MVEQFARRSAKARWQEAGGAYLYVMATEDRTKVGLAIDLAERARCHRQSTGAEVAAFHATWVPAEAATKLESHAQWLLQQFHARGEWFDVEPAVAVEAVEATLAANASGEQLQKFRLRNRRPIAPQPDWYWRPERPVTYADHEEDGSL